MATESDVTVGSRWRWSTLYSDPSPFTYVAENKVHYDDDPLDKMWPTERIAIAYGATPLPLPAAECQVCGALGRKCIKCRDGAPPPAPPPPRCSPGCTPAHACRGTACPVHYEPEEYGNDSLLWASSQLTTENLRLSPVDPPPPGREPRIGALSWSSSAAVFGGWSGRVPR